MYRSLFQCWRSKPFEWRKKKKKKFGASQTSQASQTSTSTSRNDETIALQFCPREPEDFAGNATCVLMASPPIKKHLEPPPPPPQTDTSESVFVGLTEDAEPVVVAVAGTLLKLERLQQRRCGTCDELLLEEILNQDCCCQGHIFDI